MNIDFVVNDYLLAWYVLFKPSFCEEVQELKEKQFYKKPSLEKKLQREKALKRMKRKIKKERRLGLL